MTKERKIEILKDLLIQLSDSANILCTCEADERCEVVEECIKALEQQPCEDCVSRQATLDAIIKELCIKDESYLLQSEKAIYNVVKNMPPVTPAHCIATVRFSKDDLRDICNERIEIECTHGTCKDCNLWCRDRAIDGACFCSSFHTYTGYDFYCADFERREER